VTGERRLRAARFKSDDLAETVTKRIRAAAGRVRHFCRALLGPARLPNGSPVGFWGNLIPSVSH
jgi:hypothetical protein